MNHYSDQHGTFYGVVNADGNINVLHVEDGERATRLDQSIYVVGAENVDPLVSVRYEHKNGIVLTPEDAEKFDSYKNIVGRPCLNCSADQSKHCEKCEGCIYEF